MKPLRQFLLQFRALTRFGSLGWPLAACAAVLAVWSVADNRLAQERSAPRAGLQASGFSQASSAAAPPGVIESGRVLLAAYQCGACHRIEGVSGAQGTHGPALTQWRRRSYIAGSVPNTPERLAAWIVDPSALVPGTAMPQMGVTPHDARQMAAYLFRPE